MDQTQHGVKILLAEYCWNYLSIFPDFHSFQMNYHPHPVTDAFLKPEVLAPGQVWIFDDFLSARECEELLAEVRIAFWEPSLTYQKQEDGHHRNVLTEFRLSETAHQEWFNADLNAQISEVERRISKLFDVDPAFMEAWQATDYPQNGHFDYHLDAGYWNDHYAGDRILTFLLYLTTPEEGGGTHFRALDINVEAKAGRLLVWNNLFPSGDCDHRMIHSGAPLLKGNKTTLVSWQRQKKYRL
jgi:prolyl 4-hydroxylase